MTSEATILTSSVTDPVRQIDRSGGDVPLILREAGLGADFLAQPSFAMPLRAFVEVSQGAALHLRRPDFGWQTGMSFDLRNLGSTGTAMLSAPTVGKALALICTAFQSVQALSELSLTVEGDMAVLRYRVLDPDIWPREQDAELTIATLGQIPRMARGPMWRPNRLIFEHQRAAGSAVEARARFGVFYGGAANEMHFPAAHLDTPMPQADPDGFSDGARQTRRLAREIEALISTPGLLRQQFLQRFGTGALDQTEIATSLGLSRRSLRRQLAVHGTSYSRVLAQTRQSMACHRLRYSGLSIVEIAHELGYSDQTAFERAFRREGGVTPTQYRRMV